MRFRSLFTQGMVLHETYRTRDGLAVEPGDVARGDGGAPRHRETGEPLLAGRSEKMSKSRGNVVDPVSIIETYGADTARWFMLSDSPPDRDMEWTEAGISGAMRFVNRVWRLVGTRAAGLPAPGEAPRGEEAGHALRRATHLAIDGVTGDLEAFRFNRAVARIHELVNAVSQAGDEAPGSVLREGLETIALLAGPMMPHVAEELWRMLGHDTLVAQEPWPEAAPGLLVDDSVEVAVQVRGRLRGTITLGRDAGREEAEELALALPTVAAALGGDPVTKVIHVPNRIINFIH